MRMAESEYVRLVNEVCSDESWGPTGQQMDEVVKVFHLGCNDIMEEIIRRLEKRHKSWRRCYKSLLLVDHLARNLQERYVDELRRLLPLLSHISTTFHYKDEKNVDHGLSIRERSKKVAELLKDPEYLANERRITHETQRRVAGGGAAVGLNHPRPSQPTQILTRADVSSTVLAGVGHHHGHTVQTGVASRTSAAYDPYPGRQRPSEDSDLELARRLQAEEDRRAGRQLEVNAVSPPRSHPHVETQPRAVPNEDEDLRLAMELQRQFDEADGTDNATMAITQAHAAPHPHTQAPNTNVTVPTQPTGNSLEDIFSVPATKPHPKVAPVEDFDFFSPAPAAAVSQPRPNTLADPWGDDFFAAPKSKPPQPTWGGLPDQPPPRPTTKDPFADLVKVAMSQNNQPAETSSTPPPAGYDPQKRKGDLDDLFS